MCFFERFIDATRQDNQPFKINEWWLSLRSDSLMTFRSNSGPLMKRRRKVHDLSEYQTTPTGFYQHEVVFFREREVTFKQKMPFSWLSLLEFTVFYAQFYGERKNMGRLGHICDHGFKKLAIDWSCLIGHLLVLTRVLPTTIVLWLSFVKL